MTLGANQRQYALGPCEITNSSYKISYRFSPPHDIFLLHLKQYRIPPSAGPNTTFVTPANRAYQSIVGSRMADPLEEGNEASTSRILDAWPDIHAWSLYLFKTRVEALDKSELWRKGMIRVLSFAWYTISTHNPLRPVMINTPQTWEIATRMWIEEEESQTTPQSVTGFGTYLMCSLIEDASFDNLQFVNKAAEENALLVAGLAIRHTRNALMAPQVHGHRFATHIELLSRFSRYPEHPFRHALLNKNVFSLITSALAKLAKILDSDNDPTLITAMISCFHYLHDYLESTDGFTWVAQAIRTGLLRAFCDCSPKFGVLTQAQLDMILRIFKTILPRYVVYRSVVDVMNRVMEKMNCDPYRGRIKNSLAKEVWYDLRMLVQERIAVSCQVVRDHEHIVCDNVKVRRLSHCLYITI